MGKITYEKSVAKIQKEYVTAEKEYLKYKTLVDAIAISQEYSKEIEASKRKAKAQNYKLTCY